MADSNLTNAHDLFTRQTLSHLPTARGFFRQRLPEDVLRELNLESLRLCDGSFVDQSLRENLTDLVFEVERRDNSKMLVSILFEHKSWPETYIALQLLRYLVNIWERQRQDGQPLTPVIPVVLYHGEVKWNAKLSMRQLIEAPDELRAYVPDQETCLVDLSAIPDEELGDELRLRIVMFMLKHVFDDAFADRLSEIIPLVKAVIRNESSLQLLETVLRYVLGGTEKVSREQVKKIVETHIPEGSGTMPTIADELRAEGRTEGLSQGLTAGEKRGLISGIHAVIEQKHSRVPAELSTMLNEIDSVETLQRILANVGRCESLSKLEQLIGSES